MGMFGPGPSVDITRRVGVVRPVAVGLRHLGHPGLHQPHVLGLLGLQLQRGGAYRFVGGHGRELAEEGLGALLGGQRQLQRCLLYTSDAADERSSVDLGGRRIIKKTKADQRRATANQR